MTKRKKTKQQGFFDGIKTTIPPILKTNEKRPAFATPESSSNVNKRPRVIDAPGNTILDNFEKTVDDFIKAKLNTIIRSNKNVTKKIEDFKKKSLANTRLPLGIKNSTAWNNYVHEHFDNNLETLKLQTPQTNSKSDVQCNVKPKVQSTTINRTFSLSLSKVIRKDLPEGVKKIVLDNMHSTLVKPFSSKLSEIVFLSIMLFKSGSFITNDGRLNFSVSTNGLDISKILPKDLDDGVQRFAPPPLTAAMLSPESLTDINALFGDNHMGLIHSNFFGVKGLSHSTKEKCAANNAIIEHLSSFGVTRDTYKDSIDLSSVEMNITRNTYMTNLSVMWDKRKIFNSLLEHLLHVLLRLHLAPKREKSYRKMMNEKRVFEKQAEAS